MQNQSVRASAVVLALAALVTLCLAGCSGSSQNAAQETDAQKTQREATIQKHKDAADNVH